MTPAVLVLATTLLAGLLPPTPSPRPAGINVGKPAPAFFFAALDGHVAGRASFVGHPTLVYVFATWNASSRADLSALAAAYPRNRNNVTFIALDRGEPADKVRQFVRTLHLPYQVATDANQGSAAYSAGSIPHAVVIDKHGIVRLISNAALTRAQLDPLIRLAGSD